MLLPSGLKMSAALSRWATAMAGAPVPDIQLLKLKERPLKLAIHMIIETVRLNLVYVLMTDLFEECRKFHNYLF